MRAARRIADAVPLVLPGALVVYLAFNAGGFFVGTEGSVAVALAAFLVVRAVLVEDPFAGAGRSLALVAGALASFGIWTLLSGYWGTEARALLEFDRVPLYALTLLACGSVASTPARLRATLAWLLAGITVVCTIALVSRALPHVWETSPGVVPRRLSYPITYWNALGLLAAAGLLLTLHFASAEREPRWLRIAAAAPAPVLGATLLLTFSRGAMAAGVVGLLAYALAGRPRGLLASLLALGPATAVAIYAAYDADLLATADPTAPAAVVQGRHLALVVGACAVGAVVLRALLLRLDERIPQLQLAGRRLALAGAGVLLVAAVAAVALGLPGTLAHQYDRFVTGDTIHGEVRARLTDPANRSRVDVWNVALDAFARSPVNGSGAGTYELEWDRHRPRATAATHAHSLYLQTLAELGAIGLALLLVVLAVPLALLARRLSGPDRGVYALAFALVLTWLLHAGVDWDWEMPVVTCPVFAIVGVATARPAGAALRRAAPAARAAVVLGFAAVAVVPALVAVSQHQLDDGVRTFKQGRCGAAMRSARASVSTLGTRPDGWEVLGYCDLRLGAPHRALRDMRSAVDRDPDNWELRYGLALARAAAGLDPHAQGLRALRLNPRERATRRLIAALAGNDPQRWRRAVPLAPLPVALR